MAPAAVSLPMYDVPELRESTDALWSGIAAALVAEGAGEVPAALDRARPHREVWSDPDLLLSQACGYPLVTALAGRVRVIATPRYRAEGCDGAWTSSRVVVRRDAAARSLADLAGAVCAANEPDSHSGMNGLRALVAPLAAPRGGRFFRRLVWSGGHRRSLEMVAAGEADLACIDAVTFALLAQVAPALTGAVREIARTAPCPGLPIITRGAASDEEVARLRAALERALSAPETAAARAALLLDGLEVLPEDAYRAVLDLETDAIALGYPSLA